MTGRPRIVRKQRWWLTRWRRPSTTPARARRARLRAALQWALGATWPRQLRIGALAAVCGVSLACVLWIGVPWSLHRIASHHYFALGTIEIEGNHRLDRSEVLRWAGVSEGRSVWGAAPGVVRARLLSHPWIRQAQVQREFPNRLTLSLQERQPVAIVLLDGPRFVDRYGRVLGPLRDDDSRDFPIISGLDGTEVADFSGIGLHRALQLLRWSERLHSADAVSEIHVDRERGLTVFPRRTAVAVVLGWGRWREKLQRSARVLAAWEGQVDRLTAVDLSFRDLVVVRLRAEQHPTAVRPSKRGTRV